MSDRLRDLVQDLGLIAAAAGLSWASQDLVPFLNGQPGYGAVAGVAVTGAVAYLTPIVRRYGVGSGGDSDPEDV